MRGPRDTVVSWGRYPRTSAPALRLEWASDPLPVTSRPMLPHGLGRSYGDSCLVRDGVHLLTRRLDHLLAFDPATGEVTCEAGVSLDELFRFAIPRGWFLPVTPGTRFVTVGGAIANDVHGKNHHVSGSFGDHVVSLELLRTTGERIRCGPGQRADWFRATVGGLGLTGVITTATVRLMPIASPAIVAESIPFGGLDDFFALSRESAATRYAVAWVDCLAGDRAVGRGIFFRGDHAPAGTPAPAAPRGRLRVPVDLPGWALNRHSARLFNLVYRTSHRRRTEPRVVGWQQFFHPLDAVTGWNRVYGRRGFLQWQGVVPPAAARDALAEILSATAQAGQGSFLAVLKQFGDRPAPGLLSFPRPGTTLALDFPMRGQATLALLDRLDDITMAAGGAIYPAKDAHMSAGTFRASFPRLMEFRRYRDPGLGSAFWTRVQGDA